MAGRIASDNIQELSRCEIFVFGSNLAGQHFGGAARIAYEKFGAEWGVGVGPAGQTYAIPTMHGGVDDIKPYVDEFIEYAKNHPNNRFLLTRIGCGIAGFKDSEIAPLFAEAWKLPNVNFPKEWYLIVTADEFTDAVIFGIIPEECTIHNAPAFGGGIAHCNMGEEKLIYLAQISDILPLDDYWEQYPQKRCGNFRDCFDAGWYGDNIYSKDHTDKDGNVIPMNNNGDHEGAQVGERDYHYGKNAIICERFYYFTPDKRMEVPGRFKPLVHGAKGQSIKSDGVEAFIAYVADYAAGEGVHNGIVGHIPVIYPDPSVTDENEFPFHTITDNSRTTRKKKGCSK